MISVRLWEDLIISLLLAFVINSIRFLHEPLVFWGGPPAHPGGGVTIVTWSVPPFRSGVCCVGLTQESGNTVSWILWAGLCGMGAPTGLVEPAWVSFLRALQVLFPLASILLSYFSRNLSISYELSTRLA